MLFSVKGYHTCKLRGTAESIRDKVPFLSGSGLNQWLGQGYYFWTDTDYWARHWGREPKVISRFNISLNRSDLLDLVGNVEDQMLFKDVCEIFEGLDEALRAKYGTVLTVGAVFKWLRDEVARTGQKEIFRYWAVRAKDGKNEARYNFGAGYEKLHLVERHQICVYEEHKVASVAFDGFTYPDCFVCE